VSGPYGEDEAAWEAAIRDTLANVRKRYPSARRIVLQPVVGGPGHQTCTRGGARIRASWQHAHIDNAIARVVAGDVVAGFSPEVRACADYSDETGHLTREGARAAAASIGAYYKTGEL
jgi:hypothetical protein